jgi:hypothetical protein
LIKFRPTTARFLSFRTADVSVATQMCRSCGTITMRGDSDKLRLLEAPKQEKTAHAEAGV